MLQCLLWEQLLVYSESERGKNFMMMMRMTKLIMLLLLLVELGNAFQLPPKNPNAKRVKFSSNYFVNWAPNNTKLRDSNTEIQLSMNNSSGSAFASRNKYMYGYVRIQIKLIANESSGTVTTFYMASTSPDTNHDELDFEFLGNTTGQPYIVHTNVFANGTGGREQRIYCWFDPTADFHSYAFLWNEQQIIFYIDDVPIRVFKNNMNIGVPYPSTKPMGIFASLWNGEDWATRGGLEKIKWNHAPFVASYKAFGVDACVWSGSGSSCTKPIKKQAKWYHQSMYSVEDDDNKSKLKWVKDNQMVYDYCTDTKRYPTPPAECQSQ